MDPTPPLLREPAAEQRRDLDRDQQVHGDDAPRDRDGMPRAVHGDEQVLPRPVREPVEGEDPHVDRDEHHRQTSEVTVQVEDPRGCGALGERLVRDEQAPEHRDGEERPRDEPGGARDVPPGLRIEIHRAQLPLVFGGEVGGGGGGLVGGGVGAAVAGGDVGAGVGAAAGAAGADGAEPAPEGGPAAGGDPALLPALVPAPPAGVAPAPPSAVVPAAAAGVGGAPAAGIPSGVVAAAAAPVPVDDPVGVTADADSDEDTADAALLAGAPDASTATMMKVAVVLNPVASTRLAAAGRERLVALAVRMAVLLACVLVGLGHPVVAPGAVERRGGGRRGGRGG